MLKFLLIYAFLKKIKTGLLEVSSIHKGVTKKDIEQNTSFKVKYKKGLQEK